MPSMLICHLRAVYAMPRVYAQRLSRYVITRNMRRVVQCGTIPAFDAWFICCFRVSGMLDDAVYS